MKVNRKIISLLFLISILFSLLPKSSLAQSDIPITFTDTIIFQDTIFNYTNSYNQRNISTYTNFYNATFDFNNDIIGSNPVGFLINEVGGSINVIEGIENHNKVLELNDTVNSQIVQAITNFTNILTGTMELYMRTNNANSRNPFLVRGDGGAIGISIENNVFNYLNFVGAWISTGITALANQWYHIKIDFDISNSGYKGLTQGYYQYYINNILFPEIQIFNTPTFIEDLRLYTNGADFNYKVYYDAIGFSWGKPTEIFNFINDIVGNEPIGWISDNGPDATTVIDALIVGKVNVLDAHDKLFGKAKISTNFTNPLVNSFQFDLAKSQIGATSDCTIFLFENDRNLITLQFFADDLIGIKNNFLLANTFATYKLFLNYSTDTFDIFIDDILEGSDIAFTQVDISNGINALTVQTSDDPFHDNIHLYTDDFILDNIDYIVNSNIIPFLDISNIIEVDRYEFGWIDFETRNTVGNDFFSNWNETDVGNDRVNIVNKSGNIDDKKIEFNYNPLITDALFGIFRDFNLHGNIINVSWNFNFTDYGGFGTNTIFKLNITSFDGSLISEVYFHDFDLKEGLEGNILKADLSNNTNYGLNLYVNYLDNLSILSLHINDSFSETFPITILNSEKEGIGRIELMVLGIAFNVIIVNTDYIGLYINGIAHTNNEFGFFDFNSLAPYSSNGLPIITFNGIGVYSFTVLNFDNILSLRNFFEYFGSTPFNTYDNDYIILTSAVYRMNFLNDLDYTSLKVSGITMNHGSDKIIPIYTSNGINTLVSFFYVDSQNRLAFNHIANDTSLEFIQLEFNLITLINTNDRTIIFQSAKNNIAKGFFQIGFDDATNNVLQLPNFISTTSAILTQDKSVDQIIITITDDDINSLVGLTTGYIKNIVFGFGVNFNITLATLSLLLMLVPLLIILLPTLLIGLRLGKESIIPLFLLMSLLCVITEIIPIWLFFIIAISSSVFILRKKNEMI